MIYTRFYYVLCLQLLMNFSPLCFRFVRHFVQEHLTDISLSVCVCVADEGERKMKKLNEMNRFWILFNLEEICLPMLFMCCNCSFNGRAISQQESNVIKIYFTRDIDSVFFFILFLTQNLSRLLLILFGLCVLILQSNILVFYFFPFSPILNLTWDDIFLHEKKVYNNNPNLLIDIVCCSSS